MARIGSTVRVVGPEETITKLGNMRREPQRVLRQVALARADKTVQRFQSEMLSEYTSEWATGAIARSIKSRVTNTKDGVAIAFTAQSGARNHLQYITGIMPDSYFKTFPVAPFDIQPVFAKLLYIRWPGQVRKFIQNPETGRMEGSEPGRRGVKVAHWGSKTGGFKRDVISEVSQAEGAVFVAELMAAVKEALRTSSQ